MTFLDIRDESEFQSHLSQKIEQYRRSASPSRTRVLSDGTESPPKPTKAHKDVIRAIRLGNNYLTSVEVVHSIPAHLDSSQILWLDLSFNYIETLSEDFALYFPNVSTIYLHANKISKLSELKKLSKFTHLRSLSLYGNPVEEHKHYRNYVLYYCPHLTQFDKSPVTKSQINKVSCLMLLFLSLTLQLLLLVVLLVCHDDQLV